MLADKCEEYIMVEKTASQVTDKSEASTVRSVDDTRLADMQAFQDATKLAKAMQQIDVEKSEGRRPSNTLDPFPKFVFNDDEKAVMRASEPTSNGRVVELKSDAKAHTLEKGSPAELSTRFEGHAQKAANAPHEASRGIVSSHKHKDGSRTYTYKDKTTETISRDGEREVKFPDGSGYRLYPDGRKLIRHDEDMLDQHDAKGNIEWRLRERPNGDLARTDASGRLTEYFDKSREHYAFFSYDAKGNLASISGQPIGEWRRETRPDGTNYWQNANDPKQRFDGEMTVDSDGNIRQTSHNPDADIRIFKNAGASIVSAKRTDAVEQRTYDETTGKLIAWGEKDEQGSRRRQFDPKTGKLNASDTFNRDGSWEHSEFAENGQRTVMVRNDGKGNQEKTIFDPATGKEVASDIKFKDGSTMHVVFDPDGSVKEVSSKDKDGNVNQWKRDADNKGTTVKDIPRPEPLGGIGAKEIKFPNGFKVHLDFAPSSGYVAGIWTSDRDVKGVKDVNISSIRR